VSERADNFKKQLFDFLNKKPSNRVEQPTISSG